MEASSFDVVGGEEFPAHGGDTAKGLADGEGLVGLLQFRWMGSRIEQRFLDLDRHSRGLAVPEETDAAHPKHPKNIPLRAMDVMALSQQLQGGVLEQVLGVLIHYAETGMSKRRQLVALVRVEQDRLDDLPGGLGRFHR